MAAWWEQQSFPFPILLQFFHLEPLRGKAKAYSPIFFAPFLLNPVSFWGSGSSEICPKVGMIPSAKQEPMTFLGTTNTQDKKAVHLRNNLSWANISFCTTKAYRSMCTSDTSEPLKSATANFTVGQGFVPYCRGTGVRKKNSAWCWHPYLTSPYCNTRWPGNRLTWNNTGKGRQQPAHDLHDLQLQARRNPAAHFLTGQEPTLQNHHIKLPYTAGAQLRLFPGTTSSRQTGVKLAQQLELTHRRRKAAAGLPARCFKLQCFSCKADCCNPSYPTAWGTVYWLWNPPADKDQPPRSRELSPFVRDTTFCPRRKTQLRQSLRRTATWNRCHNPVFYEHFVHLLILIHTRRQIPFPSKRAVSSH